MEITQAFDKGGILMWIIAVCSLLGTAVFIERLIALRRVNVLPDHLYKALLKQLSAGDMDRAQWLCRENQSVLSRIVETALTYRHAERSAVKEAMEEVGQVEIGHLSVRIHILSTVAAIAPLLGLLGTVAGMIEVFDDLKGPEAGQAAAAAAGAAGPSIEALAEGIEHALYTTLGGLAIAIPFYVAYRYVETRIDRFGIELEEAGLNVLNVLVPPPARPGEARQHREEALVAAESKTAEEPEETKGKGTGKKGSS